MSTTLNSKLNVPNANGAYKTSSSFTIVDPFDIVGDFQLDINKEVFGLNEEVIVDGLIPGLPQGSGVTITVYKPDGDTDEFGSLVDNSRFSWMWQTPIAEKPHIFQLHQNRQEFHNHK